MSNKYSYIEDKRTSHILNLVDVDNVLESIKIGNQFKIVVRDSDFKCIRKEMTPPKFTQAESKIQSFNKGYEVNQK